MKLSYLSGLFLTLSTVSALSYAQGDSQATIEVAESEDYGQYLTNAEGETLYLFVNEEMEGQGPERMTEGVREAAAPCQGGCLDAWPPLNAEQVEAGEGVDEELLYTADVGGNTQAVYNGWPLYLFVRDSEPGQINGQGVGQAPNHWYIVSPDGNKVDQH